MLCSALGVSCMNAIDLLKTQHKEVKTLFRKMHQTEAARERSQLLEQIALALEGHTTIEEEMFYPAVKGLETKKAEEMVAEAYEEHHVVKLVLAELPQVDVEDEHFGAKMTVLSELVEHPSVEAHRHDSSKTESRRRRSSPAAPIQPSSTPTHATGSPLAVTASSTAAGGVPAAAARAKSMRRSSMAFQPTSRAMRNTSESGVVSSVQV